MCRSATIRAEMAELERCGFIMQPHTSAGRIPTDKGYRFYVNELDRQRMRRLPERRAEKALATRVQDGGLPERTIRNAVDTLVDLTHNLGLATIGNQLYMSGLSNLFGQPEFIRASQVQQVASLLDNLEPWLREAAPNEPLSVYIGAENPIGRTAGVSLIISRFRSPFSDHSYIGTLGPTRQSYRDVMTLVRHAGETLRRYCMPEVLRKIWLPSTKRNRKSTSRYRYPGIAQLWQVKRPASSAHELGQLQTS